METKQKAIIVTDTNLKEFNELLSSGWKVLHLCGMPSSLAGQYSHKVAPTALIIIEKTQ